VTETKSLTREQNWARMMVLAQAGDGAVYERLLKEISAYVKSLVKRKLSDVAQVDDLNQDILMAIHKARHTYDSSRPFMPWLHSIIRFRLTDQLRKIYRSKRFEELDLDSDYHETYSEAPAKEEIDASLLDALHQLPEKQRLVVQLLKLKGFSVKEAAVETGMSESALKVTAHRAYKAMKEWLTKAKEGGNDAR
jgi:RNA polymerase sigma-70 factor (ECF subfamily)